MSDWKWWMYIVLFPPCVIAEILILRRIYFLILSACAPKETK